ncbi:MAG: efflux RND transporter periplasmic adaptor subunit [Thermoguttaceae bacterium]|nr:efflux RND transporter periplasmic adaptor subunit [Thermoguttaceae bacterium]
MKFRQAFICLSVAFVLLSAGCEKPAADAPVKMSDIKIVVEPAVATQQDVQLKVSYTGQIVPVSQVNIVPRIRGYLEAVKYLDGSIVEKGQLLFTIQDFDYKIAVEKANAEMVAAKAKEISARATYESAVKTNEKVAGSVSENDLIKYKSSWQEAYADFKLKKSQYDYNIQQLSYTKIYSPIKGKISKTNFTPGELLDGSGGNPPVLCTVMSMDPIYVEFQIPDRDFDKALEASQEYFKQHPELGTGKAPAQPQQPVTHTANYPPEENAPALPADANTAAAAPGVNEAAAAQPNSQQDPANVPAPAAAQPKLPQAPANVPADGQAVNPITQLNQEVSTVEKSVEEKLAQPFIPKDEDIAPSAVLEDNAAYMKGDQKSDDIIPFELVLSDVPGAKVYKGRLNYNDNAIDVSTGTMTIRGVLANPTYELYPGHICTVRLEAKEKKGVVVIEERAIIDDLSAKFVWVVDENSVAHKRYVEVEESFEHGTKRILAPYSEEEVITSSGEKAVKKTGLQPGETYIVEGFQKVREGMTVTLKQK